MTITGSRFVSQWLDLGRYDAGSSAGDGNPIDALYFATLIIAATIVLCRRGAKVGELASLNKCLFIFMLYGLVSVLWSDFPFIALKRWVKTLGHPLMALIILTDPDPRNAFRIVMRRCAYSLLPISAPRFKLRLEYTANELMLTNLLSVPACSRASSRFLVVSTEFMYARGKDLSIPAARW